MNPHEAHLVAQRHYEKAVIGQGNENAGAMLKLNIGPPVSVPCTHSEVRDQFDLTDGQSPKLMIDQCEFRAELIPDESKSKVRQGLKCTLLPNANQNAAVISCYLGPGGLLPGGLIYRFVLKDVNYSA